jgi:hypothetical protein
MEKEKWKSRLKELGLENSLNIRQKEAQGQIATQDWKKKL